MGRGLGRHPLTGLDVVVCVIDLYATDDAAVVSAAAVARRHGSALHIVSVPTNRRSAAAGMFESYVAAFARRREARGLDVRPAVLYGDCVKAVARYVRVVSADLLILAQPSGSEERDGTISGNAGAVACAVPCPTVMIPAGRPIGEAHPSFRTVVCGVDFSIASLRALDQAIEIATAARGQLTVVQALAEFRPGLLDARGGGIAVDDHRDWIARARRDLEALLPPASRSGCRVEATAWSGTPGDVILGAAAERHADLIVIGASERIGAGRVATGAAVAEVLRRATVPVLIVPWLPGVPRPHGALPARAPVAGLSHVSRT